MGCTVMAYVVMTLQLQQDEMRRQQAAERPAAKVRRIEWSELELVEPPIATGAFKTVHRARWRGTDVAVLRLRRGDISTEAAVFIAMAYVAYLCSYGLCSLPM